MWLTYWLMWTVGRMRKERKNRVEKIQSKFDKSRANGHCALLNVCNSIPSLWVLKNLYTWRHVNYWCPCNIVMTWIMILEGWLITTVREITLSVIIYFLIRDLWCCFWFPLQWPFLFFESYLLITNYLYDVIIVCLLNLIIIL